MDPTGHSAKHTADGGAATGATTEDVALQVGSLSAEDRATLNGCEANRYFQGYFDGPAPGCVLEFPWYYGEDGAENLKAQAAWGTLEVILGAGAGIYVNWDKQSKHMGEQGNGRSYLTISNEQLAEMVGEHAGSGQRLEDKNGNRLPKERVTFGSDPVGYYVPLSGPPIPTNRVMIIYSNTGVHVYPIAP